MRINRGLLLFLALCACASVQAAERILRVAVQTHSPPMSYVDASGNLAGFNVGVARALCETMNVRCELAIVPLERVVDALASGEFDFAAMSLLNTPERQAKIIFSKPYYRSTTVWFAKPGIEPESIDTAKGTPHAAPSALRVGTVAGSIQSRYAQARQWKVSSVRYHSELPTLLLEGKVDAVMTPMISALALRQNKSLQSLGLVTSVMREAELGGDVCFGVDPTQPELRERIDRALDKIKRDGRFDRLNTEYLPFRLQ